MWVVVYFCCLASEFNGVWFVFEWFVVLVSVGGDVADYVCPCFLFAVVEGFNVWVFCHVLNYSIIVVLVKVLCC